MPLSWLLSSLNSVFIVHDAGHQEIFSAPAGNEVLGLIHSNLLLGFSYSWWLHKHHHHHCSPNHVTADPDVDIPLFAFTKDQAATKRGFARLTVKYQHFCFFPLSLFEAFVLKVDSVKFLLRHKVAHPLIEVSFSFCTPAGFWACSIFFSVGHMPSCSSWRKQMFLGLYLTLIFAPNHQGMPLLQGASAVNFCVSKCSPAGTLRSIRESITAPEASLARSNTTCSRLCLQTNFDRFKK